MPVLDKTGDAKQSQPFQIYSKNLSANSGLYKRLAIVLATLLYASRGVSVGSK